MALRLTAGLLRASSALIRPVRARTRMWFGADPSLVDEIVADVNTYAPLLMQEVEGSSRRFKKVRRSEVRAEMLFSMVAPRSSMEADFELPRALSRKRYPLYYLEPFHGQPEGYLGARGAAGFDAVIEWLFDGKLGEMRQRVADALGDMDDGTIVDLGTGTGALLRSLRNAHPHAHLVGVDLSPYMLGMFGLRHADDMDDVELVEADLTCTPLESGCARGVTLSFVLHELPTNMVREALREAHRLLEPGGRLVILDGVEPQTDAERIRRKLTLRMMHEPYVADFTRMDLSSLVSELGFGPLETTLVAPSVGLRSTTKR